LSRRLVVKTLPPASLENWVESDVVLIHAAFQVLVDFVEKQRPQHHFSIPRLAWQGAPIPQADRVHLAEFQNVDAELADWQQIFALYRWWKQTPAPLWAMREAQARRSSRAQMKRLPQNFTRLSN
jgi:hypothetical protein